MEADLTVADLADGFSIGNMVRGLITAKLATLGGDREAQQAVGDRDQRRGAGADLLDDFGMMRVEAAGERAEGGQDQLGGGGDEAAAARRGGPSD